MPFAFFLEALDRAWSHLDLPEGPGTKRYLAGLLAQFSPEHQKKIDEGTLLIQLRAQALREKTATDIECIRGIADASLLAAGLLGPYLIRHSQLGMKFYIDVGERAYALLAERVGASDVNRSLYRIFASGLSPYAGALNEIRAACVWKADMDEIMRMCRKHLVRDTEESRQWFAEHGIVLLPEVAQDLERIIVTGT